VYDLYAVSNHYGGYGGGHYTAYCCDGQGAWHCFDDSHVSPIDAARVQSPAAYVLFYRRRAEAAADPGASLPPPQHGKLPLLHHGAGASAVCNGPHWVPCPTIL